MNWLVLIPLFGCVFVTRSSNAELATPGSLPCIPGLPGPKGEKGFKGVRGYPGRPGFRGRQGPASFIDCPLDFESHSRVTRNINPVDESCRGLPGAPGEEGDKGDYGIMGMPGERGLPGRIFCKNADMFPPLDLHKRSVDPNTNPVGPPSANELNAAFPSIGPPGLPGVRGIPGIPGEDGFPGFPGPAGLSGRV